MTAIATAPANATRSLRTAGILFVIAGVGTPVEIALFNWGLSIHDPSGNYVPSLGTGFLVVLLAFLAGGAVLVSTLVGFVLLFSWDQGWRQSIFFVPGVGSVLGVFSFGFASGATLVPSIVIALGTILSGILVYQKRIFLTAGSLIFLLAMIVAQVPTVGMALDPLSSVLGFELRCVVGACYVVAGVAMIGGAAARHKLIRSGAIAR
jgi:hypothetical protein